MSSIKTIRRCPTCGEDHEIWEVDVMSKTYLAMRCKKCINTPEERLFWGFEWLFREESKEVN